MLYNTLDLPSGTVPVTKVSQQDVEAMSSYPSNTPLLQAVHQVLSPTHLLCFYQINNVKE